MLNLALIVTALGLVLYAARELAPFPPRRLTVTGTARARPEPIAASPLDKRYLLALAPLWILATLWETEPLYRNVTTAIPAGLDAASFAWNLWWMKYALLDLHRFPFVTTYVYAPQRVNLAFHTFTPLNGVLSIPLQLLFGLNAALNILLLAAFVASALGAFLLVRQETDYTAGAVVGSLAFPFAPYVLAHLSAAHINIVTTWAVPFFALYALRWLRAGRPRHAALAGLFLGLDGLNDLNQVSYCIAFGLLAALYAVVGQGWNGWRQRPRAYRLATPHRAVGIIAPAHPLAGQPARRWARRLAPWMVGVLALGGVALLIFLPELAPFIYGLSHGWTTATPLQASSDFSPDLASYITPLYLHPLWGRWAAGVAAALRFLDQPKIVFVGFTTLALALLALVRGERATSARMWWAMALIFWAISLGPYPHVWGVMYANIPLPYLLYHRIPLIGGGRIPGYASIIISLCLAVLAGHGIAYLSRRLPRLRWRIALTVAAGFLILFESLSTPLALFTPWVDPVYVRLAREPGQQAVLEEPLGWRDGRISYGSPDTSQMYAATVSHKPMVGGFVARVPDSYFQFYAQQPALAQFITPDGTPTPQSQDRAMVRAALRALGVGYIIVHRYALYDRVTAYVRAVVGAREMYTDAQLTAYRVS